MPGFDRDELERAAGLHRDPLRAAGAAAPGDERDDGEQRDSVAEMLALAAAAAAALALVPTPIGVGTRYHPPPAVHGTCVARPLRVASRVHVELFANRRVVIIPAAIGLGGARFRFGRVTTARCRARLWTTDPSGVVSFEVGATLGDLFAVWGQPLGPALLASFRGAVRLYRNGVLSRGDPRRVDLRGGDELVLEIRGYVAPHRSYRFPPH
jgi:hypothetical protein